MPLFYNFPSSNLEFITEQPVSPEFIEKLKNLDHNINQESARLIHKTPKARIRASVDTIIENLKLKNKNFSFRELVKFYTLLPDYINWYETEYNLFSDEYLELLKKEILNPQYLKKNKLSIPFGSTRGFNLLFKSPFKDKVIQYFPFFKEFINEVFSDDGNIYFVNALVLNLNTKVDMHRDKTLYTFLKDEGVSPLRVAVLYVDVPDMTGGDLYLLYYKKLLAKIKPETNKFLYFKGNLFHEIEEIHQINSSDKNCRISLVCEIYNVGNEDLKKIPNFVTDVPRANWFHYK